MSKPYPTVTPYLVTTHAAQVADFLKKAFNATEAICKKERMAALHMPPSKYRKAL